MGNEVRGGTPAPEISPKSGYYNFSSSEHPPLNSIDPSFGIKECKGLKKFASSICWLSKDKQKFHIKFNLGPYDFKSK